MAMNSSPNLQPILQSAAWQLLPLQLADFEAVYAVASDPLVWEQHPNKDRWKREVFAVFFEGAMQSGGAFKVVNKATGEVMGCTRFYDYQPADKSIHIGYTFYGRDSWGKGINLAVKRLMLDYIFQWVDRVDFHVGAQNIRSQKAMERLGARKLAEKVVAYYGEPDKLNFVYAIDRSAWRELSASKDLVNPKDQ